MLTVSHLILLIAAGGNFSLQDMVALSGAHTIGHSRSVAPTVSAIRILQIWNLNKLLYKAVMSMPVVE